MARDFDPSKALEVAKLKATAVATGAFGVLACAGLTWASLGCSGSAA
jgi:hypothetical protein